MPVPHFQTLYLHPDAYRVRLQPVDISIGQLGRLHFTKSELAELADTEKKRKREMAFNIVDRSALPVATRGREAATAPKIGISGGGQMVMNGFINKAWTGVERIAILLDSDSGQCLLMGFKEGEKCAVKGFTDKNYFVPTIGKPDEKTGKGGGDYKIAASSFLKTAKYDYTTAGNQTFDAAWNEKFKGFIFTIPKVTPTAKPVVKREKKAVVVNGVATAPVPVNVEAPKEEELILE